MIDPHPDREPGMNARVFVDRDGWTYEYAKSADGSGLWFALGDADSGQLWAELARQFPTARVDIP